MSLTDTLPGREIKFLEHQHQKQDGGVEVKHNQTRVMSWGEDIIISLGHIMSQFMVKQMVLRSLLQQIILILGIHGVGLL